MSELRSMISALSGSLGDKVFSHNQYGPYQRDRTIPAFPDTPQQTIVNNWFSRMMFRWVRTLTRVQRTAWDDYASRAVVFTPTSQKRHLTGQQHFLRSNMPMAYTNLSEVRDAPTETGPIDWTTPFDVTQLSPSDFLFSLNTTDLWATSPGGIIFVQVSAEHASTVNFFNGPWRRATHVVTSPGGSVPGLNHSFNPFPFKAGPRRWIRSFVRMPDGRVSSPRVLPFDNNV